MQRMLVILLAGLLLNGCSGLRSCATCAEEQARAAAPAKPRAAQLASDGTPQVTSDGVVIEKLAFRAGRSSATVEKLAKKQACVGGMGAGLVTSPGPVEVYRMVCDNGKVFLAKCELRQCKPMR